MNRLALASRILVGTRSGTDRTAALARYSGGLLVPSFSAQSNEVSTTITGTAHMHAIKAMANVNDPFRRYESG